MKYDIQGDHIFISMRREQFIDILTHAINDVSRKKVDMYRAGDRHEYDKVAHRHMDLT